MSFQRLHGRPVGVQTGDERMRNRRPGSIGVTGGTLGEAAMQMGIALVLAT